MELTNTKKLIIYLLIIVLSLMILVLGQVMWYSNGSADDRIFPGVYINEMYVGEMSYDEAIMSVDEHLADIILDSSITIVNDRIEYPINIGDVSDFDAQDLVDKALLVGRHQSSIQEYLNMLRLKFLPQYIDTSAIVDYNMIYTVLERNKDIFTISPVDAGLVSLDIQDNNVQVVVSPSTNGYELDVESTVHVVQEGMIDHSSHVFAVMQVLEPHITTQNMMNISNNPYVYHQAYSLDIDSNVPFDFEEADAIIEPAIIMPGESLSIKQYIGYDSFEPYTASVKMLHIPTVIYAAIAQVGLETVEHHSSEFIVPEMDVYSLGQEAVLDYDKDLIIRNNNDTPVVLDLSYSRDYYSHQLVCSVYTAHTNDNTFLKSVVTARDLQYFVKVYRMFINPKGGFMYDELVSEHSYPVPPEIIEPEIEQETQQDS